MSISFSSFRKSFAEKMTQLTQDEIVSSTKTVISGLESLKIEHHAGLQAVETNIKSGNQDSSGDTVLSSEKSDILRKSLDMIDIGIEEAKVSTNFGSTIYVQKYSLQFNLLNHYNVYV